MAEDRSLELTLMEMEQGSLQIRPADVDRDWMDATPQRYAYRCLPLVIANSFGWEILSGTTFTAVWDGGQSIDSITIDSNDEEYLRPVSHFGSGVLTFSLRALIRTPKNIQLMASGPYNRPKDAIAPLTGIIETDWSPYTFTMNWLFTRADHEVTFEKGEPICMITPVECALVERLQPVIRPIADQDEDYRQYREWDELRRDFIEDLKQHAPEASEQGWQRNYFHGKLPDAKLTNRTHRTKLKVKTPRRA